MLPYWPEASPLYFVAFWCLVCLALSHIGGWNKLAKMHPARRPPEGKCFRRQSGVVGGVNYNTCLTIHISPEGIHIVPMFLFRAGHPPLLVPWSEIHHYVDASFSRRERVRFEIGNPKVAAMTVPKEAFENRAEIMRTI